MTDYAALTSQTDYSHDDLVKLLSASDPADLEVIQKAAEKVLLEQCGDAVYSRGLIEASNACNCDCLYCGIRKSNRELARYTLSEENILDCARVCLDSGYASMVIQTGERSDPKFLDMLVRVLERVKTEMRSDALPDGLGVTLSLGQQSRETYQRLFDAGAHRYLLRIETTNPDLFAKIHPADQTFESRVECLQMLRDVGYQVGTGVMIGLPGQTLDDLANDIQFFKDHDIDMIGMGPFIPHPATPLANAVCPDIPTRVQLTLQMVGAVRLYLRDVNIVATTALQALDPIGREKALQYGANIIMPLVTPQDVRKDYQLYPGKPCLEENATQCRACLELRITSVGRRMGYGEWGDSAHARRRRAGRLMEHGKA